MNYPKRLWLTFLKNGKATLKTSRLWLTGLLVGCALLVSGCQSNSQMPVCVQSQVVVDPSLMVEPSYQTTLLNSLSSKPNEQTPK